MANDLEQYRYANLASTLTPQQYAEYRRLNAEFKSAYGSDFGDFDYYEYLTNPEAARNTDYFANTIRSDDAQSMANLTRRKMALENLKQFFSTIEQTPEKIDSGPIFDRVRGEVNALSDQQRRQATGDINRSFAGAGDRVSESLAGTGLGRSGAAVSEFSNVETQRATAEAGALERVETARLATEQKLAFDEMQFDLNQELLEQGFERTMLQDALNFNRQLQMMNFQAALQYEPSSWLDTFGGVLDIISQGIGVATSFSLPSLTGGGGPSSGAPGGFAGTNAY